MAVCVKLIQKGIKFIQSRDKSVFSSWLISYVSILLIPIVISTIVYVKSSSVLHDEVTKTKMGMLIQVQQMMDSRIQDARRLAVQIGLNPDVLSIANVQGELQLDDRLKMANIIKTLRAIKQGNEFVDDFYIYLPRTKLAVTPSGYTDGKYIFESSHKYQNGFSYEDWLKMVSSGSKNLYLPLIKNTDGVIERTIAYVQTIPIADKTNQDATIVIMMKEQRFKDILNSVQDANSGEVLILANSGQIMASTGLSLVPLALMPEKVNKPSDILYERIKGEKVVVSYVTSKVTDWKYVAITPVDIFMEKTEYLWKFTLIGILICFIVGGVVVYWLLKKHYGIINKLVQSIASTARIPRESGNEFNYIQQAISTTVSQNHEMLSKQKAVLRLNFLSRLLKGRVEENVLLDDILTSYDLKFHSEYFAVMLFRVDDYEGLFPEDDPLKADERLKLVQFIITNVVEELAAQKNLGVFTEVDEMLACIINFKKENVADGLQELLRIADEAQKFIQNNFSVYFTLSIGNIHSSIYGLPTAYQEALEAMEYKLVIGNGNIIQYQEIGHQHTGYHFSFVKEQHLINSIKSGDFENAKSIINEILQNSFYKTFPSLQIAKCLFFDLVSTMLKTLDEISLTIDTQFLEELNPTEKLLNCKTVKEMETEMIDLLRLVCEHIKMQKSGPHTKLTNDIIQYIQDNYQNDNLSISMIGDVFELTPSYMSKLFKEQVGEGMNDYINKIRIEHAKQALLSDVGNIEEIANRVGYTSSTVFIRIFKKYEGVTPGKYKEFNRR